MGKQTAQEVDVTKTGNGERGTGNGERESGNECTAVTRLRIQNGGGNNVYKHWFLSLGRHLQCN